MINIQSTFPTQPLRSSSSLAQPQRWAQSLNQLPCYWDSYNFSAAVFLNFYIIRSGKYIFTRTLWLQVSGRKVWLNVFFDFLNFFSIFKHFSVWLDTGSDFFLVVTFEFHLLIWSGISLICEKCQLLLTAVATTLRPPCAVSQTHVALIGLDFFFCFLILQPASSLSYCVQMRSRRAISL